MPLHRRVEEFPDTGEFDDLVELRLNLTPLHSEDGAVEEDVLAAGQLGIEAGAYLEQAADAAADDRASLGRRRDPRQHLQERRLAGAVRADHAEHLALVDLEADVPQRPDLLLRLVARATCEPSRGA
jgi:hypothetical protein